MTANLGIISSNLTDEEIIAYYEGEGYTCMPTGETDEETGKAYYMFANVETGMFITYCDSRGVVQDLNQMDTDDDEEED